MQSSTESVQNLRGQIDHKVSQLQQQLEDMKSSTKAAAEMDTLRKSLKQAQTSQTLLQNRIDAMESTMQSAGKASDLTAIRASIKAIEEAAFKRQAVLDNSIARITALYSQVKTFEEELKEMRAAADVQATQASTQATKQQESINQLVNGASKLSQVVDEVKLSIASVKESLAKVQSKPVPSAEKEASTAEEPERKSPETQPVEPKASAIEPAKKGPVDELVADTLDFSEHPLFDEP